MENALGQPQTIVLLGGTSDIGLAIVRQLLSPTTRTVVLACRRYRAWGAGSGRIASSLARHRRRPVRSNRHRHARRLRCLVAEKYGDIDVAIVAFSLLGDGAVTSVDVPSAVEISEVNFTGVVSSTIAIANQMRQQGHGSIVMLSSVAGERVRRANPVYGAPKRASTALPRGWATRWPAMACTC